MKHKTKEILFYLTFPLVAICYAFFINVFVHEFGHYITAVILGAEDSYIDLLNGKTVFRYYPKNISEIELVLITSIGSFFTLTLSLLWGLLYRIYKESEFLMLGFGGLMLISAVDLGAYMILDNIYLFRGDWHKIYLINPYLLFLFAVIGTLEYILLYFIVSGRPPRRISRNIKSNMKNLRENEDILQMKEKNGQSIDFNEMDNILELIESLNQII